MWIVWRAQDPSLKHTLQFGIGLHHAGLADADRRVCEALFVAGKIQERILLHCPTTAMLGQQQQQHQQHQPYD